MKEHMNKRTLASELSGIRQFNTKAMKVENSLLLTLGEPDYPTPEIIKDEVIKDLDKDLTHYAATVGRMDLIKKIIEFEKRTNGITYETDEVIITNGSTEAITASLFSIINEGDEVIIPTPAFTLYECSAKIAGATYIQLDTTTNNFQISFEMINNVITDKTKCIVLTSPSNPTGTIYTKETMDNIYQAIKGKPIFVICDDCYEQLVYNQKALSFSKYQDIRKQIIVTKSFSKSYAMTGWRIGYLMADREIAEEIVKYHQFMVTTVNTFIQSACIKALEYNPIEMINDYKKRRDFVYSRLLEIGMDVVKPEGAFYIFPSIKKYKMSSLEFCDRLLYEEKVAFVPGIYFQAEGYVRISYCVDTNILKEAIDRLERFIRKIEETL